MGNSLRCCLACVLPCGALDLIRIVHLNGHVDEISRTVTAAEILKSNPNHLLTTPCSHGVVRKILILSPDSELKRGSIYFLIPDSSLPADHKNSSAAGKRKFKSRDRKIDSDVDQCLTSVSGVVDRLCNRDDDDEKKSESESKLNSKSESKSNSKSESKLKLRSSSGRDRRRSRGQSGVWQPHLESINEDL